MWPRKRIDVTWGDLAFGLVHCLAPGKHEAQRSRLEAEWAGGDSVLACLSARTGLDLLLQALDLPRRSEVVMSAVTIPGMVRVVEHHGLVPVPVDLDLGTAAPSVEGIQAALSPATRAVVVAPLFGARWSLDPMVRFCNSRGLYLIEDCAQAFCGSAYRGHPGADASLFSFGPIKTATALGGALLRVRDPRLLLDMRDRQAEYPVQSRFAYARRLAKYAGLRLLLHRALYGLFFKACSVAGRDPERLIGSMARNFGGGDLIASLRRQPPTALLALLRRRLRTYNDQRAETQAARGRLLADLFRGCVLAPGSQAESNTYWVFPIVVDKPELLIAALRSQGFDATQAHSLTVVRPPAEQDDRCPLEAERMLRHIVFLPCCPEMPVSEIERLARVILANGEAARTPGR